MNEIEEAMSSLSAPITGATAAMAEFPQIELPQAIRIEMRVGSTTVATYMIPDHLGAFHRAHPAIELHIVSANTRAIADLMIGHEIEVALVEGPVEDRDLVSEPWRTDAMVLIAAPSHPFAAAAEPVTPETITGEILIIREPGSGSREIVADALAARSIKPARTLEIGSTEAIKQVVAAGLGLAIVSAATIKDQVALGKLKVIPWRDFSIERTLWQIKKPGRLEIPAARAFETLIRNPAESMVSAAGRRSRGGLAGF